MTFSIPATATFYTGSGNALAVIVDGVIIDAEYTHGDLMAEPSIRRRLAAQHPDARIVSGMMSCYEFTPWG